MTASSGSCAPSSSSETFHDAASALEDDGAADGVGAEMWRARETEKEIERERERGREREIQRDREGGMERKWDEERAGESIQAGEITAQDGAICRPRTPPPVDAGEALGTGVWGVAFGL